MEEIEQYMVMGNIVASLKKGGWRAVNLGTRKDVMLPLTVEDMEFLGFHKSDVRTVASMSGLNTKDVPTLFSHAYIDPHATKLEHLEAAEKGGDGAESEEVEDDHANWL